MNKKELKNALRASLKSRTSLEKALEDVEQTIEDLTLAILATPRQPSDTPKPEYEPFHPAGLYG